MPRKSRIDSPGTLHHVMFRGIERRDIFVDERDYNDLLKRLETLLPETKISCYAWSLLPNHAHFLLRTSDIPLSTLMRRLLTGYVVSFNLRHNRCGQLFQNRYKSIICQEDLYLKELVRYIHLNPIRAGIVSSLEELDLYKYCGHSALTGKKKNIWQNINYILSCFGKTIHNAKNNYITFVANGLNQEHQPELAEGSLTRSLVGWHPVKDIQDKPDRMKGNQRILGDSDFIEKILSQADEQLKQSYYLKSKGYNFTSIEKKVCSIFSINKDQLYNKKSCPHIIADAKALMCYWAVGELNYSKTEIAKRLNRTVSAIVYAVRKGEKLARERNYSLFE